MNSITFPGHQIYKYRIKGMNIHTWELKDVRVLRELVELIQEEEETEKKEKYFDSANHWHQSVRTDIRVQNIRRVCPYPSILSRRLEIEWLIQLFRELNLRSPKITVSLPSWFLLHYFIRDQAQHTWRDRNTKSYHLQIPTQWCHRRTKWPNI